MEDRESPMASEIVVSNYLFEQFRVPWGCLGDVVADAETNLVAMWWIPSSRWSSQ